MKNFKVYISGLLSGIIIASGFTAFASPVLISAYTDNDFKYEVNGKEKQMDLGYSTLVYGGRSYVPVRFVAEALGAKVDYDGDNKKISFKLEKEPAKVDETSCKEYVDKALEEQNKEEKDNRVYESTPIKKTYKDFTVTMTGYSKKEGNLDRIYLELENKSSDLPLKFNVMDSVIQVGKDEYRADDVYSEIDVNMFKDVKKDETLRGYISFPLLPDEAKNGVFKIRVVTNGYRQDVYDLEFNFKR